MPKKPVPMPKARKAVPIFPVIPDSRSAEIIPEKGVAPTRDYGALHKDPSYLRERDSAVRGLRDVEGGVRLKLGRDDPLSSQITVARQWVDTLVARDDILILKDGVLRKILLEHDQHKKDHIATVDRLEADNKALVDKHGEVHAKLTRIPRFVRAIFGAL